MDLNFDTDFTLLLDAPIKYCWNRILILKSTWKTTMHLLSFFSPHFFKYSNFWYVNVCFLRVNDRSDANQQLNPETIFFNASWAFQKKKKKRKKERQEKPKLLSSGQTVSFTWGTRRHLNFSLSSIYSPCQYHLISDPMHYSETLLTFGILGGKNSRVSP